VPGTTVVASPWLKHKIINTGARELKMTWTMTPPGLETYFRKIGRPRKAGEASPPRFDPAQAADEICSGRVTKSVNQTPQDVMLMWLMMRKT